MHVVVNVATSADGKLSSRRREQVEISGPADFRRVDELRADSDAVMVGVGTVVADDPSLTVDDENLRSRRREAGVPENPARIVADSRIRTPPDAAILDDAAETFVLTSDAAPSDYLAELEEAGATVVVAGEKQVDVEAALETLETQHDVERVMVEGGGELIFSLFEAGLVDELFVYVGPSLIGGREAPTLADGEGFVDDFVPLELRSVDVLDEGALLHWVPDA